MQFLTLNNLYSLNFQIQGLITRRVQMFGDWIVLAPNKNSLQGIYDCMVDNYKKSSPNIKAIQKQ